MRNLKTIHMKKLTLLVIGLIGILFASCIKEANHEEGRIGSGNYLRMVVDVQSISTQIATRASVAPVTGEDQIGSLYLLFFRPDANKGGKFVDYMKVDGPLVMNTNIALDLSSHPLLSVSAAYNILAIANIDEHNYVGDNVANWIHQWDNKTELQVMTDAMALVKGGANNDDNGQAIGRNAILMNGRTVKNTDQYDIKLTLSRNVSRFDVNNSAREEYDLVSVSVWNAHPTSSIWGEGVIDYSSSASRIRRFYGLDNSANTGEAGGDGKGPMLNNIAGGLYAFENRVASPVGNDKLTTCLIIGMRERATGTVNYYRVNVHPDQSAQVLKRNNAYRVTINRVTGPGKGSEELAYTGAGNNLDYVINYWDLDDNGLIVQDGTSILSIPSKTVRIGRNGGESNYSIFTFSGSTSASGLAIKSQTYDPATNKIRASLNGNTLVINADPLDLGEDERRGVVILSFAGLEASINIIQSGSIDTYLRVVMPDGGIPKFAPFAGIPSGLIQVQASGPWTAKLVMLNGGFSFASASHPVSATTTINSASPLVTANKFQVWTHSANPLTEPREAFIVVSLDSDPENYASVIMLTQKNAGGIDVTPAQTRVTFNGAGTGLAAIANNTTNEFHVYPSKQDDVIDSWSYRIVASGASNDTDKFKVDPAKLFTSTSNIEGNSLTVEAVGINTSGRVYNAKLEIFLTNDESKKTVIELAQQPYSIDVSPNTFTTPISVIGGQTDLITVQGDASLQWSATLTMNTVAAPDGRRLVNHAAILVDEDGNEIAPGSAQPMSKKFRVKFPQVYYPNRQVGISAAVTVTIVGSGGVSKTITVSQAALMPKALICSNLRPGYWGAFQTGAYVTAFYNAVITKPSYQYVSGQTGSSVAYLHIATQGIGNNYNWSSVKTYMSTVDGVTLLSSDTGTPTDYVSINGLMNPDYNIINLGTTAGVLTANATHTATRMFLFMTTKGTSPISPSGVTTHFQSISPSAAATTWPATAIPIIVKEANSAQAVLTIDPKKRFIYAGELEMFNYDTYLTNGRGSIMNNLVSYIYNTARYGHHFSDLLCDDCPLPAPWDDAWGANKGVTNN